MRIKRRCAKWINCCFLGFLFILGFSSQGYAKNHTVNLTVGYKTVTFAGKPVQAIAVNNQIPAPTLHFKEGDHVSINVYNHLNRGTSIHWHGIIVPWKMDGVDGVTQKPIPPGGVFHYRFTLHQSGTYWYHAHSELQEQEGLYGAIVIEPLKRSLHYNKDFVIVLSDWNNAKPEQVYANLKKDGDFYSINMPMQPSIVQFLHDYNSTKTPLGKTKILNAYKMMQAMRMSIYDISDVAYDAYLLNGHSNTRPWTASVKVGDTVRLRFVGAGASTIFNIKIPNTTMKMVQANGNNVKPYAIKSFNIAPGETFDVLVKITKNHPYIIYAESIDSLGAALGALLTQPHQVVDYKAVKPFPRPRPVMMMNHGMHKASRTHQDKPSMSNTIPQDPGHNMMAMKHHGEHTIHGARNKTMPHRMEKDGGRNQAMLSLSSKTKYDKLQSLVKTNNPNTPVHVIRMDLSGYMDRYIWFLNGVPEYKAKPIMIKHGQWYRVIFTNNTMMHHPMHIHGHWFILRNGHGAYDPKLHTIDVPPGATIVADFDADTSGQWFFHCHNLLHMKAGMANIFRYEGNSVKDFTGLSGHKAINWYYANLLELNRDFIHHTYEGTLNTLVGSDYNKLQLYSEDTEIKNGKVVNANIDVFYWRLISQFWAIKGGLNYVYRPAITPYIQPGIGIEGLMPYFIQTDVRAYLHDGSTKLDIELARDTQVTHRIFFRLALESIFATKTIVKDELGSGLNSVQWTMQPYYQLTSNVALYLQYQHTNYYGSLRRVLVNDGEATQENRYSLGISFLF